MGAVRRGQKRSREEGGEARRERLEGGGSEREEEGLGFCGFYTMGERLEPMDRRWTVKTVGPFGLKWTWFA